VDDACYVIELAAATGWTEHFIRWRLPLMRGLSYLHKARELRGIVQAWLVT